MILYLNPEVFLWLFWGFWWCYLDYQSVICYWQPKIYHPHYSKQEKLLFESLTQIVIRLNGISRVFLVNFLAYKGGLKSSIAEASTDGHCLLTMAPQTCKVKKHFYFFFFLFFLPFCLTSRKPHLYQQGGSLWQNWAEHVWE